MIQFRGWGDININFSILTVGKLHMMHSMIVDELQFHEAHSHTNVVESKKQATEA